MSHKKKYAGGMPKGQAHDAQAKSRIKAGRHKRRGK